MAEPLLALDTSTGLGSVAVGTGERLLAEVVVGVSARHSESLLPGIDYVLRAASVEPRTLGGIVVSGGPGSFTGLRIAAATAKGLCHALGIPLYAYSGLAAAAASAGAADQPVCALFDARRGEVYAACYRFPGYAAVETLMEPTAEKLDAIVARCAEFEPLYTGDGAERNRAELEAAGGRVVPPYLAVPRGGALLWLARVMADAGRIPDAAAWEPEYVRAPGVTPGGGR